VSLHRVGSRAAEAKAAFGGSLHRIAVLELELKIDKLCVPIIEDQEQQ
jgi:hypothetical protein